MIPRATVRLQLHKDFDFDAAAAQVDYFAALGVSHVYASPLLMARAGSQHGYDIMDPTRINPELGGEEGLRRLVARLRAAGMGLIADIVPNHMGVGGDENPWWQHMLEWGPDSRYARWFDIDWHSPDPALQGKVLLPFLGDSYAETLQSGALVPTFDAQRGRFYIAYHQHRFPLSVASYPLMLADGPPLLAPVAAIYAALHAAEAAPEDVPRPDREAAHLAACTLLAALNGTPDGAAAIAAVLARMSPVAGGEGMPPEAEILHRLLELQHYRLTWWRNAAEEINWRRFFEVTDLAGVRVEEEDVFAATHERIFWMYREGLIDGVRIDHVDGLANPAGYCRRLRARLEALMPERPAGTPHTPPYIVVEKILAHDEYLCPDWDVDGTTGYEFMDQASALFHDPAGAQPLAALWSELTGDGLDFPAHVQAARRQILGEHLVGEFIALSDTLHALARCHLATRDIPVAAIRRVLTELLVSFPVYRTYADDKGCDEASRQVLATAQGLAAANVRAADQPLLETLVRWLGGESAAESESEEGAAEARDLQSRAITRFQQLTPPLAAKSTEDTAFYRYGVLLSRNEVGSDPAWFALTPADFHRACEVRARTFPANLLATATHDHKRGEDVRARLAALSEFAAEWGDSVRAWQNRHAVFAVELAPERAPEARDNGEQATAQVRQRVPEHADELMLYQTIVGAWPLDLRADDVDGLKAYAERIAAWQEKALREAKRHSSWALPDPQYESICRDFVFKVLDGTANPEFVREAVAWMRRLTPGALANGMGQTLLRLCTPGVPDLYQGAEFWDFSLVDPDNRRPVDYAARRAMLGTDAGRQWPPLADWGPGQAKQALVRRALALRQHLPLLFASGDYVPLEVSGALAGHVLAFIRSDGRAAVLGVVTRLRARDLEHSVQAGTDMDWGDTRLHLPVGMPARWGDVLGDTEHTAGDGMTFHVQDLLGHAPVALLSTDHVPEETPDGVPT